MVIATLALSYIYPQIVTYLPDVLFSTGTGPVYDPSDDSVVNPDIFK